LPTSAPALRCFVGSIACLEEGNFGEHRFLRDGVWELKIDVGPGYRVYYAKDGKTVILLSAGSKRTQRQDIDRAVEYWNDHQARI